MARRAGVMDAPSGVSQPVRGDSGAGDTSAAWKGLADAAGAVGNIVQPELSRQAEVEAAGRAVQGDFSQRSELLPEDQAYNHAVQSAYVAKTSNDIDARLQQIELANPLNVEGFDRDADAVRASFLGNVRPEYALHAGAIFDRAYSESRGRIARGQANAAIDTAKNDLEARATVLEDQMSGIEDTTSADYQSRAAEYHEVLRNLVANPAFGVSQGQAEARFSHTLSLNRGDTIVRAALGAYHDAGASAASAQAAMGLLEAAANDPSLTLNETERDRLFGEGRRQIMQAERERLASLRQLQSDMRSYRAEAREEARDTFQGLNARAAAFQVIPPDEIDRLADNVRASGSPALARQYNELVLENRARDALHGRSLVQIEQQNDAWRTEAAGGGDRAGDAAIMLRAGQSYADHVRTGDPLTVAQEHFGEAPPPLFDAQGHYITGAMEQRITHAEHAADEIGAAHPTYFTPGERASLAAASRAGGANALGIAQELVTDAYAAPGDGFQRAQQMLHEIGGEGGEALASAGTVLLLGGRASDITAGYILTAQARRVQGYQHPDFPGVNDSEERQRAVASQLGANMAGLTPEASAQLRSTADMIFEGMVGENPARLADWRNVYPVAVRAALGAVTRNGQRYGGVATLRDQRVVIPNWIRADQFENIRNNLTTADYVAAGGGVGPRGASDADLRQAYLMWTGEPGKYWLAERADGTGHFESTPGEPYVLDLNRLRDRLATVRPSAVAR